MAFNADVYIETITTTLCRHLQEDIRHEVRAAFGK